MSEKMLKISLSELATVRIVCKNPSCGAVAEMAIERLATASQPIYRCPFCNRDFMLTDGAHKHDVLGPFAKGILDALSVKENVAVEFVIPAKD